MDFGRVALVEVGGVCLAPPPHPSLSFLCFLGELLRNGFQKQALSPRFVYMDLVRQRFQGNWEGRRRNSREEEEAEHRWSALQSRSEGGACLIPEATLEGQLRVRSFNLSKGAVPFPPVSFGLRVMRSLTLS